MTIFTAKTKNIFISTKKIAMGTPTRLINCLKTTNNNGVFICLHFQSNKLIKSLKFLHIKELIATKLFKTLKHFFITLKKFQHQCHTKMN